MVDNIAHRFVAQTVSHVDSMLSNKSIIKSGFYSHLFLLAYLSLFIGGQNAAENIIHKLSLTESCFFLHMAAYFVASALGVLAMADKGLAKIIFIVITIFFYSYFLEMLQYFHPYRTFNFTDVLANGMGIFIYLIFYQIYRLFFLKPRETKDLSSNL